VLAIPLVAGSEGYMGSVCASLPAAGNAFCQAAKLHMQLQSKHDSATSFVDAGNAYKKADPQGKGSKIGTVSCKAASWQRRLRAEAFGGHWLRGAAVLTAGYPKAVIPPAPLLLQSSPSDDVR